MQNTRNRGVLVVFALFTVFSALSGHAADKGYAGSPRNQPKAFPEMPPMPEYELLMELPDEAREHYFRQLQLLMVDMVSSSRQFGGDLIADQEPPPTYLEQILVYVFPAAVAGGNPGAGTTQRREREREEQAEAEEKKRQEEARHQPNPRFPGLNMQESIQGAQAITAAKKDEAAKAEAAKAQAAGVDQCKDPDNFNDDTKYCDDLAKYPKSKNAKENANTCIYAGNILEKPKGSKTCQFPKGICANGMPPGGNGKCGGKSELLKCEPGNVPCSPITFGVVKCDGKSKNGTTGCKKGSKFAPICAPLGGKGAKSVTRYCTIQAGELKADKGSGYTDFLKLSDKEIPPEDRRAAWTKFKKDFASLCGKSDKGDGGSGIVRNCETCKVVRRRLMAMNSRIDRILKHNDKKDDNACVWAAGGEVVSGDHTDEISKASSKALE